MRSALIRCVRSINCTRHALPCSSVPLATRADASFHAHTCRSCSICWRMRSASLQRAEPSPSLAELSQPTAVVVAAAATAAVAARLPARPRRLRLQAEATRPHSGSSRRGHPAVVAARRPVAARPEVEQEQRRQRAVAMPPVAAPRRHDPRTMTLSLYGCGLT